MSGQPQRVTAILETWCEVSGRETVSERDLATARGWVSQYDHLDADDYRRLIREFWEKLPEHPHTLEALSSWIRSADEDIPRTRRDRQAHSPQTGRCASCGSNLVAAGRCQDCGSRQIATLSGIGSLLPKL